MPNFGQMTPVTYVNGGSPAINDTNLNDNEDTTALADEELRRNFSLRLKHYIKYFYQRNYKEIEDCLDYTEFTDAGTVTLSRDETNTFMGSSATRLTEDDDTASYLAAYKSATLDLSTFNDGSASSTSDMIEVIFYISDVNYVNEVFLKLGDDNSNCYRYTWSSGSVSTGWNVIRLAKTDFTTVGAPTGWNSITYVRIEWRSLANASGEYVTFQFVGMYREDPVYSGYHNVFQEYQGSVTGWINKFTNLVIQDFIVYDEGKKQGDIGIMCADPTYDYWMVRIVDDLSSFITKWEWYCKADGEIPIMSWRVDSNNYVEVYVDSDTFYMDVTEAGATTSYSESLDNGIEKNEKAYVFFEKDGDTLRSVFKKDGERELILEHETTISGSDSGDIYIGCTGATNYGLLTDFVISNNQAIVDQLDEKNRVRYIQKQTHEYVYNSNSLQDDNDLYAWLGPNSQYRIELFAAAYANSSTPDIKLAWTLSGGLEAATYRYIDGPPTANANVNSATINASVQNITSSVAYAIESTGELTCIKETFVVKAEEEGGKLQLRWAQNTANTSYTNLSQMSFMIITKIK
jgi:hypothetical protein